MALSPWHDVMAKNRELRKGYGGKRGQTYRPLVSVIVPAWNEEVGLVQTVKTILSSTYTNTEVIVVNDGSTDKSDFLMRTFDFEYKQQTASDKDAIELRYYYKPNGGKGSALNFGIKRSRGDIIISTDADCALAPTALEEFVSYFRDPEVMAAVGNVKIGNTNTVLGTLQYLEFLFSFYFKKTDSLLNTIYIIGGAAGAFRREVFQTVGLYSDKNITEDIDLSVRIQEAGMKIVYAERAVIYTEGASTLSGLMAQRLRWKRGRFQTFSEHAGLFFSRDPRHNKFLTWFVLPFALFGDVQLFFEILFLGFLYFYSVLTHDFSSFLSGIVVVSSMFFVQIFEERSARKFTFLLLAPIGWLLFYVTTVVEYRALIKSIKGLVTRQDITWQRWQRTGCFDAPALASQ
jgi:cellulose synthase/poly-beta-1,6-N-acetylglucosamine synthase-like glycosyltransferase